jgi:SPP1 family predicted phage head-tail adaptor
MGKCKRVDIPSKVIVCAGDLRYPITLHVRDLTPPDNVDFGVTFTTTKTVRAAVVINNPISDVDDTNTNALNTHLFYVRYDSAIDNAYMVEWDSTYYTVNSIEELDFRKNFLKLICSERGDTAQAVNLI